MVLCQVCKSNTAKYRCPDCRADYCQVKCFVEHKEEHKEEHKGGEQQPSKGPNALPQQAPPGNTPWMDRVTNEPVLIHMILSKSLQLHLQRILLIMSSTEGTKESRRGKALRLMTQLRANGDRENEEFEEFAQHVLSL